ncbi:acyltransferase family protein [Flavobacterium gawalongense]|uniref:Acyltransferase n=1 Tax=Flavobacterium gawalongense TaxID=2594432 RepID=A0A553BZ19_9FLAO|nr:acyltransferase [Flavobacterium gawalongense]TRX13403.1 acyltransferase [Flavobacterium gawalongense]TRX15667.1 acyltransferase [Flavobacterium gawalongense]TRX31505.1 acyltransferase [Flavobacterium gawalongense]
MKRDFNLDFLKGFLIILVVYGHIPFEFFSIEKSSLLSNIGSLIYFFHMPLFFTVSALFIKSSYDWLIKRASLILAPYLFWFFYGNRRIFIENTDVFFGKLFMGNWHSIESVLWFLPALFSLNVLVFLFYKGTGLFKSILFMGSLLTFVFANKIIVVHNLIPFGLDVALYIFLLTYFIRFTYENKNLIEKFNIPLLMIMTIISFLLLFQLEPIKTHTQWHSRVDLAQFSVPTTIVGYISFMILNISIFILFLKIKSNHMLAFIGTYSFPIFLMHLMILYRLPMLFKFDNLVSNLLFMVITFILSITVPIVVSRVLMRISDKFKYIGLVK